MPLTCMSASKNPFSFLSWISTIGKLDQWKNWKLLSTLRFSHKLWSMRRKKIFPWLLFHFCPLSRLIESSSSLGALLVCFTFLMRNNEGHQRGRFTWLIWNIIHSLQCSSTMMILHIYESTRKAFWLKLFQVNPKDNMSKGNVHLKLPLFEPVSTSVAIPFSLSQWYWLQKTLFEHNCSPKSQGTCNSKAKTFFRRKKRKW